MKWVNRKRKRGAAALLAFVLVFSLFAGGSGFLQNVTLDTEKHLIYQRVSADDLLTAFSRDKAQAKTKYEGKYLCVLGRTGALLSSGSGFTLNGVEKKLTEVLYCTGAYPGYSFAAGDLVLVCGRARFTAGDPLQFQIDIAGVRKTTETRVGTEEFCFADSDRVVSKASMNKRSLGKGNAAIYIPDSWKAVEGGIEELELGTADGFQYRLSDTKKSTAGNTEQLFVFYLDMYEYVRPQDWEKTWKIEKAVVENIVPNPDIFFLEWFIPTESNTYGTTFHYYETAYQGYSLEFVFAQDGEDGFVCFLYLYRAKPAFLDDILYTLRFLEL
ncbi:MAG: hypothetical protein II754_04785 [Lachnospiraceae bacterium]|nr:hypothetical protein [Lachnospiraceae bacterium]